MMAPAGTRNLHGGPAVICRALETNVRVKMICADRACATPLLGYSLFILSVLHQCRNVCPVKAAETWNRSRPLEDFLGFSLQMRATSGRN